MGCRCCHKKEGYGFLVSSGAAFGWMFFVLLMAMLVDTCEPTPVRGASDAPASVDPDRCYNGGTSRCA